MQIQFASLPALFDLDLEDDLDESEDALDHVVERNADFAPCSILWTEFGGADETEYDADIEPSDAVAARQWELDVLENERFDY